MCARTCVFVCVGVGVGVGVCECVMSVCYSISKASAKLPVAKSDSRTINV